MRDFVFPYVFAEPELRSEECLELSGVVLLDEYKFLDMSVPGFQKFPETKIERLYDLQDDDAPIFFRMLVNISLKSIEIDSIGNEELGRVGIEDIVPEELGNEFIPHERF